ncbi:MAG: ribosome biogenesis GTPase YlqF [Lachnospiraceae bacterium]|nr:ribosome biogenesis GTPase YlqF [Lachnospiraceae bacterium]
MAKEASAESFNSTSINWYPGHMNKALKAMREDLKLIDVVIELVDARIPYSSKNPEIDQLASGKKRVILLNKGDFADPEKTKLWVKYYESRGFLVACVNSKEPQTAKVVTGLVLEACREKIEKDKARGMNMRPVRALVCGIPNVGKSTFINTLAKKNVAKTGNKPGVTTGKQWIRLNNKIELLDTPGVLWPKFEDEEVGKRIAWIGSINENILNTYELTLGLCEFILKAYPGVFNAKYGVEECEDPLSLIEAIAIKRNCMQKGNVPDLERVVAFVSDDFKNGRLGKLSLEVPGDRS